MKTDILEMLKTIEEYEEECKIRWTQDSHERAYDQGWIDALKWVYRDEVDHAIREEN